MNCAHCGSANQDDFKFCLSCGETLPRGITCRSCAAFNQVGFIFCMQCGSQLGLAPEMQAPEPALEPGARLAREEEASPAPQPSVVIVQQERRSGIPAYIWMLGGMLLAAVMCGCLLWTGLVDMPPAITQALPGPLPQIVEAIDNQRLPVFGGPLAWEPEEEPADEPEAPAPAAPPAPAPPPAPAAPTENPFCREDLLAHGIVNTSFESADQTHDDLLVFLAEEPIGDYYVQVSGTNVSPNPSYHGSSEYFDNEAQNWVIRIPRVQLTQSGETTYTFRPRGAECVIGEMGVYSQCPSSEEFHAGFPYNGGCCTKGCWCKQAGKWSCWTTCNSWCAD